MVATITLFDTLIFIYFLFKFNIYKKSNNSNSGSPVKKCQTLRRNGDNNATIVFIGLRHPLAAKIQVINVNDSLYRV